MQGNSGLICRSPNTDRTNDLGELTSAQPNGGARKSIWGDNSKFFRHACRNHTKITGPEISSQAAPPVRVRAGTHRSAVGHKNYIPKSSLNSV